MIPRSHSEEFNNITLLDQLNKIERCLSNFQTRLDQVVAQNIMFNERLNNVSSYSSKVKSSVITSLQKNVVPVTDGKTTVAGHVSQPIITKSDS